MSTVLLIVHLFVTLALIGVVLIQRSEGGGLGVGGGGGGGMGSFMSGRGTANLLTRTTSILAAIFFTLSLTLALLNRGTTGVAGSILGPKGGEAIPAAPIGTAPAPLAPSPGSDAGPGNAPTSAPLTSAPTGAPIGGPIGGSATAPIQSPNPPPHSGPSVPIN